MTPAMSLIALIVCLVCIVIPDKLVGWMLDAAWPQFQHWRRARYRQKALNRSHERLRKLRQDRLPYRLRADVARQDIKTPPEPFWT